MAEGANAAERGADSAMAEPAKASHGMIAALVGIVTLHGGQEADQPAKPSHGLGDLIGIASPPPPPPAAPVQSPHMSSIDCEPGLIAQLLGLFSESSQEQGGKEIEPTAEKSPGFVERELERRQNNANGGSDSSSLEKARILPVEEREKLEIEREGPSRGR